jgi:hypothetical protein
VIGLSLVDAWLLAYCVALFAGPATVTPDFKTCEPAAWYGSAPSALITAGLP